ncbi:hypothetical protein ACX80J_14860 [Arthrobacter sp. MDB2-24]
MCGACGRTVVADPALGPVRTTRDLLVVAQLVNSITTGLPGGPVVRVSGDSWILAGRTGSSTRCDTVEQLWTALLQQSVRSPEAAARLRERIADGLPGASPLAGRVLQEGLSVCAH